MMMVENFKKEINNSLKELQENTTKQVMELSKTIQDIKNGNKNNEENPNGDNSRDRNPRKEIRKQMCEHQQQNTRDGRKNLRCRRLHRKHGYRPGSGGVHL
jgi:hypothetical protein